MDAEVGQYGDLEKGKAENATTYKNHASSPSGGRGSRRANVQNHRVEKSLNGKLGKVQRQIRFTRNVVMLSRGAVVRGERTYSRRKQTNPFHLTKRDSEPAQ